MGGWLAALMAACCLGGPAGVAFCPLAPVASIDFASLFATLAAQAAALQALAAAAAAPSPTICRCGTWVWPRSAAHGVPTHGAFAGPAAGREATLSVPPGVSARASTADIGRVGAALGLQYCMPAARAFVDGASPPPLGPVRSVAAGAAAAVAPVDRSRALPRAARSLGVSLSNSFALLAEESALGDEGAVAIEVLACATLGVAVPAASALPRGQCEGRGNRAAPRGVSAPAVRAPGDGRGITCSRIAQWGPSHGGKAQTCSRITAWGPSHGEKIRRRS